MADHELPGNWTVKLTVKRRGIRGHQIMHWPPLHSGSRSTGIDGYRAVWWLERTIRDLAGQEAHVIRIEMEPVRASV
jgi:hypothetical protein